MVVNTTVLLLALRTVMVNVTITGTQLDSYIIPLADAHQGSRMTPCDQRLKFISGFTGSSGVVIVRQNEALLWTDGRYFTQAGYELDDNWTLMKDGLPDTPSPAAYLSTVLPNGASVGVDPMLYSNTNWNSMNAALTGSGKRLYSIQQNLVDLVWNEQPDKPVCNGNPVFEHPLNFSGRSTSDKLADIRAQMTTAGADIVVLSELDEVAWLFNLRGSDLPSASVFHSYAILKQDLVEFFINPDKIIDQIRDHLRQEIPNLEFIEYSAIVPRLQFHVTSTTGKVWFSPLCNYALVSTAPPGRQLIKITPLSMLKSVKNPVEVEGMRNALIRDASALVRYYSWLQDSVVRGDNVTEMSAAEKLMEIRRGNQYFQDTSFTTISASGPNAAVIHYRPAPETNRQLNSQEMYLVDAGALYLDGTTDITRTFHFGNPTEYQKDCYTRVLKGQIAIAKAHFPMRTVATRLDSFARKALWEVGLDYGHGTGHGIGHFLNVHEGPFRITYFNMPDDPGLQPNQFTSNEPGYYEENEFGIRLENIIRVTNVSLEHNFANLNFLGMEDMTFLPYAQNLILTELLTQEELEYLNDYQDKCRTIIGGYMQQNGMNQTAIDWLWEQTQPL